MSARWCSVVVSLAVAVVPLAGCSSEGARPGPDSTAISVGTSDNKQAKLAAQEEIIRRQQEEIKRQQRELDQLRQQEYYNERLKKYEK
jgi:hypothetical protein